MQLADIKLVGRSSGNSIVLSGIGKWPIGVQVSFQWYSDGQIMQGETGISHVLVNDDKGHSLVLRATGKCAGYDDVVKSSPAWLVP